MKKQGFLIGSFVLIVSVLVTKVIGLMFKIPLANMLGGTGMGYFSCAYAVFMPVFALSVTGFPAAISRLVAENAAFGKYANVRKIRRVSVIGFSVIGLVSAVFLLSASKLLSEYVVSSPKSVYAIAAIAPCIFFGAVTAVYRGYFEGINNMVPTAISQTIEAAVKLLAGLGFASAARSYIIAQYDRGESVFGIVCKTVEEAQEAGLPFIAAAAVLGVTLSSAAGCLYLTILYKIKGDGITRQMIVSDKSSDRMRNIFKSLVMIAIPIAIGSVITSLTSLVDLATIIRCLKSAIKESPEIMLSKYSKAIESGVTPNQLPDFLYGSFTGLAGTVFGLVPAFTAMFGKSAIPGITAAWAKKDKKAIENGINAVLLVTVFIAMPAGLGTAVLSKPILELLFSNRLAEVSAACAPLSVMSAGLCFLAVSVPVFSVLQAIGCANKPVIIMLLGLAVKLIGNLVLCPIPGFDITGAAMSTVICYGVICVLSIRELVKLTGVKIEWIKTFVKPFYASLMCCLAAYISYTYMSARLNAKISLMIALIISVNVYILCAYLLEIMTKNEFKHMLAKEIS